MEYNIYLFFFKRFFNIKKKNTEILQKPVPDATHTHTNMQHTHSKFGYWPGFCHTEQVTITEHLAANEADILSGGGGDKIRIKRGEFGLTFVSLSEARHQLNTKLSAFIFLTTWYRLADRAQQ